MVADVHDVAIVSDFRYPGGTSASIAEEVRAQAAAGLSTVLLQLPSPHNRPGLPFSPQITALLRDGAAQLAHGRDAVTAKLLVIRQPRIFTEEPAHVPAVRAERKVMVINQAPGDAVDPERYYRFAEVHKRAEACFGEDISWAPISPQVREQVLRSAPSAELAEVDWHEIIDVADWWVDRRAPVADVPVIGRHGRADAVKWPQDPAEILQAYPDAPDFKVRILGGGELAVRRLGHWPASWEVLPFGSVAPRDFLRTIDYFVYFHDSDLIEAFGRTILEAMASGVPAVIPEHFRAVLGDAALYSTPAGVQDLVRWLHADWDRYRAVAARARAFVEERFGHPSHLARLARCGVELKMTVPAPRTEAGSQIPAVVAPRTAKPRHRPTARVLMISDNGAGLGHLSRLMAVARRLPQDVQPVIATQSYGASVAHREGFLTEYVPSRGVLGMAKPRWRGFLRERLRHLISVHRPTVVLVDSVPHDPFLDAIEDHPELTWVWLRRAMWRPGLGANWVARSAAFDAVLEPGEFAAAADQGATAAYRADVRSVAPITFLDSDELLDASAARQELGLDERPAALVQLGAGNINDIASPAARITDVLVRNGFQPVLVESTIATEPLPRPAYARVVRLYPVSRYLRAFDLVVSAAGYNSFHELLGFAVPTVLVPNRRTSLDDQLARARYAAEVGAALTVENPDGDELETVLGAAVGSDVRAALATRCADLRFGNGAVEAAAWVHGLCTGDAPAGAAHVREG